ncbi:MULTISPECIES: ABC transporter ATP-binding protein [Streptomyces]|jgi:peptide/nickel transport system ATP-binding protein|uniref:ABC transporter ATP-binding protein n=1 Tax=Streptomyces spinosisporus TaxID=2927582 RepID=A0ABS9XLI5_9ACTN|nr:MULTISPECIES: ABC transporter ATP-binding protein [Streptomyces]EPD55104.1 oligopeptide/dipeptide ABC transporter, ATP-binding protein domain [Streptomyces sp. HGB0020]MCI3242936.1 ABC transporter ATP-binding protein [Streptomyces spinosisporus]WUB36113.1 ABC transporter ATP-binding protein [Streptomyces sp. NBC_00588]
MSTPFLSIRDLRVHFGTEDGVVKAVDGLSFDLEKGRTLGIVGESGSGKSVTNLAVLGLHDPRNTKLDGEILLDGKELITASEREMEQLRGNKMSMIFQDALASLSPYHTIGAQIGETYRKHTGASKRVARARAIEMLRRVGIPQPDMRVDDYPHQFSGGMRQRAMIAMALVCDPELLIADEPTTALDVTVQAQIMDLLKDLQQEFGTAIIFITHDLGVIADIADDVLVMYGGRCVEKGTKQEVLRTPEHPYTLGLLGSMPSLDGPVDVPLSPIPGAPPSLLNPPSGCRFHPRCTFAEKVPGDLCSTEQPALKLTDGRGSACHLTPEQKRELFADYATARTN